MIATRLRYFRNKNGRIDTSDFEVGIQQGEDAELVLRAAHRKDEDDDGSITFIS